MEDFPAAHSMDTEWFAVDRDGRVAVFDSWDYGAVPRVLRSPVNADPAAPEIWAPERTGLGAMVPVLSRAELERALDDRDDGARILFARDARSLAKCKRILNEERPKIVPLRDGHALFLWRTPPLFERLLARWGSKCVLRGVPADIRFWQAWLWACGFIHYACGDDQDGAAYRRLPLLSPSVSLKDLPADVVEQVSVVRLDCSFLEKESVQPCRYVACLGYASDQWFDEDDTYHRSGLGEAWRSRAGE